MMDSEYHFYRIMEIFDTFLTMQSTKRETSTACKSGGGGFGL
jgi:hypothetical protein